jgi:hypothetical protein
MKGTQMAKELSTAERIEKFAHEAAEETEVSCSLKKRIRSLLAEHEPTVADMLHVVWWMLSNMHKFEGIPDWAQLAILTRLLGQEAVIIQVEGASSRPAPEPDTEPTD